MGPWAFAASIVSMIVGAGIFAVPAELAASIGPYAPLAFLACGIAIGAVAICFAEGGSRVPTSGGISGVIEIAFGPLAGYVAGVLLFVCCVLACGAVTAALADVVATLFPSPWVATIRRVAIVTVIGGIAFVNIRGVASGARLVSIATAVKLLPLAIFLVAGATAMHVSNFASAAQPNVQGVGRALILAVFALVGMEAALCASGEVVSPNRTVPRALLTAIGSTTILYVAIQTIAQGILGPALVDSKAPLADAMARIHPLLRTVMLAGTALSMLGWLCSDLLGSPRQLFAFAQHGVLPRAIGRVNARNHAPDVAIVCYGAIAIVLALTGTFAELVALSTLCTAALYIGGCAAAWRLARRGVASSGSPLNFRYLNSATAVGTAGMLVLIALGSRQEIGFLAGLISLTTLMYFVQARMGVGSVRAGAAGPD